MQKKTMALFVTLGVIVLLGVSFAAAFQGGFGFGKYSSATDEEKAEMQAFHDSKIEAIENNDFDAWRTLMISRLTEENFNKLTESHSNFQEKHELMLELREAIDNDDTKTIEEIKGQFSDSGFDKGFGHKGFYKNRNHFGFNK